MPQTKPREPQYAPAFDKAPVTLGPSSGSTWRWDPKRLGFVLARYKFVAQMLKGYARVAEIGCGDGFASAIVAKEVAQLDLYDFDPIWVDAAQKCHSGKVAQWDITAGALYPRYNAIYMLDVIEHIAPQDEPKAVRNICDSLLPNGVFIVGAPSLESQPYASQSSRKGHVNCRSGEQFKADLQRYFRNVFLFGMNDEVLHVGFAPMCHYLLAVCVV